MMHYAFWDTTNNKLTRIECSVLVDIAYHSSKHNWQLFYVVNL